MAAGRFSLLEVIRPYFFAGVVLEPRVRAALELLHVDEYDTAVDDDGVAMWGVARIDDPAQGAPSFELFTADATFEWHDVAIRFRLTSARLPAASVVPALFSDAAVANVVEALGPATAATRSDFPSTQFRLDLLFDLVSVTLPNWTGAKVDGAFLVVDPDHPEVKLKLPRVVLRITQDSAAETDVEVDIESRGAETLDGADPAIASLIQMSPSHALADGKRWGIAFEKLALDLSAERTPPDILERFGLGDDFQGLQIPEARLFFADEYATGTAWNLGVSDLLLGWKPEWGLWGDISFAVDRRGEALAVGLRLYAVDGHRIDVEKVAARPGDPLDLRRFKVTVPLTAGPETENNLLYVDVLDGAAPFTITAVTGQDRPVGDDEALPDDAFFDEPANSPEDISFIQRLRLFSHNQRVAVRVTSRTPAQRRIVVLDVTFKYESAIAEWPVPLPANDATFGPEQVSSTAVNVSIVTPQSGLDVVLRLTPPTGTLRVDGASVAVTATGLATVPVIAGATRVIAAEWSLPTATELGATQVFFEFDRPKGSVVGRVSLSRVLPTTPEAPLDLSSSGLVVGWNGRDPAGARPHLRVDGYASREGEERTGYNRALARARRDWLIEKLLTTTFDDPEGAPPKRSDVVAGDGWGEDGHARDSVDDARLIHDQTPGDLTAAEAAKGNPGYEKERFRTALARAIVPVPEVHTWTAELRRPERPPAERVPAPAPPASRQPDFIRAFSGTVRWEREVVPIAAEARMTIDYRTAHEAGLEHFRADVERLRPGMEEPGESRLPAGDSAPNPDDGVVDLRLSITYDRGSGSVSETLVARAAETDRDGLWTWGTVPTADTPGEPSGTDPWRDLLGLYFTLAPLAAATAPDVADGGDIVPLVVALATPVLVTSLGVAHVLRVTHYGVEQAVRTDLADELHAVLLLDVESALWLNLKLGDGEDAFEIVTTRPDKPVKVRYKAIGFGLDVQPDRSTRFMPVFDASRGYTIDLADSGSLRVLPSLGDRVGDIIQILGARIARTNPLNIEVDLGLGVDLGVFKVDRFGFRLPVEPAGRPTITAIGVSVDIPEVVTGSGYLEILDTGFAGQLDVRLPSVGIRVMGGLRIETVTQGDRSATGVVVTLAAEFPGGIPVAGTGLSIFGFLGLFAMHHRRLEDPTNRNPALSWLINTVGGDPTRIAGWGPALDAWAFGVGLVAGTVEGGTVLNLKGMLILELPGPRVVLFANANLLTERPETKGTETGDLFAVVDISPQRLLIGIQVEYRIGQEGGLQVLELRVPAEAGFFREPREHFFLDVGTISTPATARVLELFDATAYLMVHGDGIADFPLVAGGLHGFSLAVGFQVSLVWGDTDVGLYLKAAGGLDAGVGFRPFLLAGKVHFDGALHLFIVSIEAHAELSLVSDGTDTLFSGEICGKVSFFFFSVSGCVGFDLGQDPAAPHAPGAIRDLVLQSRSPALVEGTAVDRGVDTILCRATTDGSVPVVDDGDGGTRPEFVPIDAIPLVQFEVAPVMEAAAVDGQLSGGVPHGEQGGWQKRGPNYLRYTVTNVELRLVSVRGGAPPPGLTATTEGPRPYTWRHGAQQAGSDGLPASLAMLDWKPTNADKSVLEGAGLDASVEDRWGDVCVPVAEAARVMWTFRHVALGPDDGRWALTGEAWPDDPGTRRSQPVDTRVVVREIWRTGTFLDGLLPHKPAEVVGVGRPCPRRPAGPRPRPLPPAPALPRLAGPFDDDDAPAVRVAGPALRTPISAASVSRRCTAKVLEAPFELSSTARRHAAVPEGLRGGELEDVLRTLDAERLEVLRDVLRITGGPHRELTLLIVARSKMVAADLVSVRALDGDGHVLPDTTFDVVHVASDGDLPLSWTATTGPWWDDVALARSFFGGPAGLADMGEVLLHIVLPEPALHVDVGILGLDVAIDNFGMQAPSWYLAAIEGLSEREVLRGDDDADEAEDDDDGLGDGLDDPGHALLRPGARYDVIVRYSAEIGAKRTDPDDDQDPNEIVALRAPESHTESLTFFTDSEAPANLEPWMLVQFPAAGEPHHFFEDPVVIVFATDDVLELFAAYDRKLRAIARAASFTGSSLDLDDRVHPVGDVVLSPWQATVRRIVGDRPCRDFDPDSDGHSRGVLPFDLVPLTDYVMDLEALRPDGQVELPSPRPGEVGLRPRYRQRFTTSRYADRAALADAVRIARVVSRRVPDAAPLDALTGVVSDEILDRALLAAGLESGPRPDTPAVWKLWRPDAPATPLAVLIETPEPLWRSRLEPTPERDGTGHITRWTLERAVWLDVDELVPTTSAPVSSGAPFVQRSTGLMTTIGLSTHELRDRYLHPGPGIPPVSPPPASRVTRFVRDASGARTLAYLTPDARGRTVTLGLRRNLHPLLDLEGMDTPLTLTEIHVAAPPWELE
jgi:hypothetical protein